MTLASFSDNDAQSTRNRRFPSENISFRLPKNQLDQLRKEAEEKRISLNTLVSQLVDSYVDFVSNAPKAGMIPVSKSVLTELLEGYNEDQIKAIAERSQKKIMIDRALQLRGKYDFETLVDIFVSWLRASGFPYRHDRDLENESRHTFIVQHNMGRKYSLFLLECLKVNCEPMITGKVEYTVTDNCLRITGEGKAV
jgi:hypothetical protein